MTNCSKNIKKRQNVPMGTRKKSQTVISRFLDEYSGFQDFRGSSPDD